MRSKFAVAAILMPLMASCASSPPPQTASGRPEVTIHGWRPDQAKSALVNAALNRHMLIKSDSPYQLVVERPTQNIAASVLLSTPAHGPPVERYSFAIAEVSGGTRIVADATFVSNAGTAFENATPGAASNADLQTFLNEVAATKR